MHLCPCNFLFYRNKHICIHNKKKNLIYLILYDLGPVLLPLFFFFLSHFHNYKNESWPRSEDKFYLWPSPKDWRSCLQHCVGRIWRGIQLSRKEGHDLLPLAQVQEHGWRRVRYLPHMDKMLSFFFFLMFIYFLLHWVLVATCRTFPCSMWAL